VAEPEIPLAGGNATADVVRVGGTVRKPWDAASPSVAAYMHRIAERGVDVPAHLGRDEQGRQVLEFVPGRLVDGAAPLTPGELARVGGIVRAIHDASEGFALPGARWNALIPAPGADLVCHNDLAPWNLLTGDRWVFIDWDGAAPSTRLWDLAYSAQAFTLNEVRRPAREAADRLAAFVDGYGADADLRRALPAAMAARAAAMHDLLRRSADSGREPWGTMYREGHGAHWLAAADYVRTGADVWRAALGGRSR
jgi:Ser/Thr protein kinase RdoA (MazF antagonist)